MSESASSIPPRRTFLVRALAWPAIAWSAETIAQGKQTPIVIGFLSATARPSNPHRLTAFREGMAALGWTEGAQFVIDERYAEGKYERLAALAKELAAKKPAVIVANSSNAIAAAAKAAPTTPIVMTSVGDPVEAGFAKSLARPGGMITGVSNLAEVSEKHLEFLLAAAPHVKCVGFLVDPRTRSYRVWREAADRAVARYRIEARFAEASRPDAIEPALARLAKEGAQALVMLGSTIFSAGQQRIAAIALAQGWPMASAHRESVEQGGALLSYGPDRTENSRRAAYFVDRILKGAKPSELPIEQPTKLELLINMRTARVLKLTIPPELAVRADRIIE